MQPPWEIWAKLTLNTRKTLPYESAVKYHKSVWFEKCTNRCWQ